MELAAQLNSGDSDVDQFAKLKGYLSGLTKNPAESAALIARLLSISIEDQSGLSALTPQQIKNRTVDKLLEIILSFSAQRSTPCIFEDVHWKDPSTLELLELVISRIDRTPIMLVVSYRPEFRHAWPTHPNVTLHSLTRLSRSEVTKMIKELLREGSLSQQVFDQLSKRRIVYLYSSRNSQQASSVRRDKIDKRAIRTRLRRLKRPKYPRHCMMH